MRLWVLQERMQFCLRFHHEAGLGQLLLQSLLLSLQSSNLLVAFVAGFAATHRRQRGRRAGVTGPPPRHDVAGVQALAAQQGTLLAVGGCVVGGQDLQLVLRVNVRRRVSAIMKFPRLEGSAIT